MTKTNQGKIALVLAGGGLTGAVYEIGALRAIDDLLIDRTVNDFDIYVGTSAGSLVTSLLSNGMTPEEMLQVIIGSHPEAISFDRGHLFGIAWRDSLDWGVRFPAHLLRAWSASLRSLDKITLFDLLWNLSETLPSGLYDSLALERYLRVTMRDLGYSNDFVNLLHELYIIATDLDTGERVVFGPGQRADTPISLAVAASSALPLVYKPVQIGMREYVDGSLRGTASLDLAIERGATLVVCINPLVPFDNSKVVMERGGKRGSYLSDRGIQSVANQSLRIFSHSNLHYHIKQLGKTHPDVDIILIEPKAEDYQMFFENIMHYSARITVAQHGFQSVTLDLAEDYPVLKQTLARHGVPISRRLVIEELAEIAQSSFDPVVISRILEARRPGCGQKNRDSAFCELNVALAHLELLLDQLEDAAPTEIH